MCVDVMCAVCEGEGCVKCNGGGMCGDVAMGERERWGRAQHVRGVYLPALA